MKDEGFEHPETSKAAAAINNAVLFIRFDLPFRYPFFEWDFSESICFKQELHLLQSVGNHQRKH